MAPRTRTGDRNRASVPELLPSRKSAGEAGLPLVLEATRTLRPRSGDEGLDRRRWGRAWTGLHLGATGRLAARALGAGRAGRPPAQGEPSGSGWTVTGVSGSAPRSSGRASCEPRVGRPVPPTSCGTQKVDVAARVCVTSARVGRGRGPAGALRPLRLGTGTAGAVEGLSGGREHVLSTMTSRRSPRTALQGGVGGDACAQHRESPGPRGR